LINRVYPAPVRDPPTNTSASKSIELTAKNVGTPVEQAPYFRSRKHAPNGVQIGLCLWLSATPERFLQHLLHDFQNICYPEPFSDK
jgi:hypothetical protein